LFFLFPYESSFLSPVVPFVGDATLISVKIWLNIEQD